MTCFVSCQVTESVLGFSVRRAPSKVPGAGVGVVIARGRVKRGALVALYPGMGMTFNCGQVCEISGADSKKYEDECLLRHCTM
jgi:hypothetical protein